MPRPGPDRGQEIFDPSRGVAKGLDAPGKGKSKKGKKGAAKQRPDVPDDGVVRVARERRRGKGVTLITGVPLQGAELKALGKQLKQRCGSGGTTNDGVIEIQGDHRDVVVEALGERGWTVKRVGG